jgi:hypothetical protein
MDEEKTRFEQLTDEEVLLLTAQQIEEWIDIECANAGVPLLPERPVEPFENTKITPNETAYECGGQHYATMEDAQEASLFLDGRRRVEVGYVPGPRYERMLKGLASAATITPVRCFTPEHWASVALAANAFAEKKAAYDEAFREYHDAEVKRKPIIERIRERVSALAVKEQRRERMRGHFYRYLTLAKGNRVTAVRFLKDAYPNASELLPEIDEPVIGSDAAIQPRQYAPDELDIIGSAPERL